jgi:hypothetical protein
LSYSEGYEQPVCMTGDFKVDMYLLLEKEKPKRDRIAHHGPELEVRREGEHRNAPFSAEQSHHRISIMSTSIADTETEINSYQNASLFKAKNTVNDAK